MHYKKKSFNKKKIAVQALKEAEVRRKKYSISNKMPKEIEGPTELEPTRYGDWERKGITSDF
tara:strand:- start:2212 stop:2397 length:186 start_codon:yes stop_codon:yes gene_type:complete